MSAIRKSLVALSLLLGMAVAATPSASAQTPRGVWVRIDPYRAWTLTVINLTDSPLSLGGQFVTASNAQRPPFWGNTLNGANAFPLPPYQNVTWKSNTATIFYPNSRWNGTFTVFPQGKDAWKATLNFSEYWFDDCAENGCVEHFGTWVYLTADFSANPDWQDSSPFNISCSYPTYYNSTYNIVTLSGTDYVATLYAPYVNINDAPTVDVTLIIRQRYPHTPVTNGYQDSLVAPCLTFQDNNGTWFRLDSATQK